jgi:hypothetical protein
MSRGPASKLAVLRAASRVAALLVLASSCSESEHPLRRVQRGEAKVTGHGMLVIAIDGLRSASPRGVSPGALHARRSPGTPVYRSTETRHTHTVNGPRGPNLPPWNAASGGSFRRSRNRRMLSGSVIIAIMCRRLRHRGGARGTDRRVRSAICTTSVALPRLPTRPARCQMLAWLAEYPTSTATSSAPISMLSSSAFVDATTLTVPSSRPAPLIDLGRTTPSCRRLQSPCATR